MIIELAETIDAVVSKVTPRSYGFDICLAPGEETWVSIRHADNLPEPHVGDIVMVTVPRVIQVLPNRQIDNKNKDAK